MARSTWLGCSDPDVQADPEEAQIPNSLSRSRMASPSTYSKLMLVVLGSRSSRSPFTTASGQLLRRAASSLSLNAASGVVPRASSFFAISQALPRPMIEATFSVPALFPVPGARR